MAYSYIHEKMLTQCHLGLTESLVYKVTVLAESHVTQTYIGITEHDFKKQFHNHKMSFQNPNYRSSTTLSKYTWDLKEEVMNLNVVLINKVDMVCLSPVGYGV